MKNIFVLLSLVLFFGCANQDNEKMAQYKIQVLRAESNFALMAEQKGMEEAFLFFAADDAVLNRNDSIIDGKEAMKKYFRNQAFKEIRLKWEPDFVDVSSSGDMAYTYGKYIFRAVDSSGVRISANGIFHTVWKRQDDGSWKFVYD